MYKFYNILGQPFKIAILLQRGQISEILLSLVTSEREQMLSIMLLSMFLHFHPDGAGLLPNSLIPTHYPMEQESGNPVATRIANQSPRGRNVPSLAWMTGPPLRLRHVPTTLEIWPRAAGTTIASGADSVCPSPFTCATNARHEQPRHRAGLAHPTKAHLVELSNHLSAS